MILDIYNITNTISYIADCKNTTANNDKDFIQTYVSRNKNLFHSYNNIVHNPNIVFTKKTIPIDSKRIEHKNLEEAEKPRKKTVLNKNVSLEATRSNNKEDDPDEEKLNLPLLPLRDVVIFPGFVAPLFIGREKSINGVEYAAANDIPILLVTQKDPNEDDITIDDLYTVGTLSNILQMVRLPDGTIKVLIEGISRFRLDEIDYSEDYYIAKAEEIFDKHDDEKDIASLRAIVNEKVIEYAQISQKTPEFIDTITSIDDNGSFVDLLVVHLKMKIEEKQTLLETLSVFERLEKVFAALEAEISLVQIEKKIRSRVKKQVERTQREYYLNEQMKAIQRELGDKSEKDEITILEDQIKSAKLTKEAREKAESELKKLKSMNMMSAEATVIRSYLDWIIALPWKNHSKTNTDIKQAINILDEDHYGMEKIKERIVDYLAVKARVKKMQGPILCFLGPPGVGKTSLAKSIAKATGRTFVKVALGGVRDESEIRGHRRTYIGSMPGKIIQAMKKAGTCNPLILLDEIDKLGADWKGDPAAALLEVLDAEQNSIFNDHYMEIDYDLSNVMFIATANSYKMPTPLLDRLEIIPLAGYTIYEKLEIAKKHLIPKQLSANGVTKKEITISEDALEATITGYTREAGVRNLERQIATIARKTVRAIDINNEKSVQISKNNITDYLGAEKYSNGFFEDNDLIGVTKGLAWTEVGGDVLYIEAVAVPGKGKVIYTGKLGDVMQESIQAAVSYIRSRAVIYGIDINFFDRYDIHVHAPEGAIPKDGPSAGIAIAMSIASAVLGINVSRHLAMTGEITLRGRVLAIGGLKEKLLAAHRHGIKEVIIPQENEKNLEELPEQVLKDLIIHKVISADEVLRIGLPSMFSYKDDDNILQ